MRVRKVTQLASNGAPAQFEWALVHPVLTGIVMDFAMRAHVTLWSGMAAVFPGGWCMCVRKLLKKLVGGYKRKVAQPFLNGREQKAGHPSLILSDAQLVDMGERAQAITDALCGRAGAPIDDCMALLWPPCRTHTVLGDIISMSAL